MMVIKKRFFHSLLIMSMVLLVGFISSGIAIPADSAQIIIGENLKPGMTLKEAIQLLGPPESIKIGSTGTVIIPYDSLGLTVEVMNEGTVIEAVHLLSTFTGKFSTGLGMGVDYKEILSAYNQPDVMTKDRIEYTDTATVFQISQGKLVGADLHSEKGTSFHQMPIKETGTKEAQKAETVEDEEAGDNEDEITEEEADYDVLDLYGFKVKNTNEGVVITEIRPASVAEYGGLKAGERIRKAFYKGTGVRNIYSVGGLETILKRAVSKRKKFINILQNGNQYYKVEVPNKN